MLTTIRALLGAALVVTAFGVAVAKLPPAPPMTDEQKAEKAAKDKAAADTTKAQLTKAEDRVVTRYIAEMKAKGVAVIRNCPLVRHLRLMRARACRRSLKRRARTRRRTNSDLGQSRNTSRSASMGSEP